jgi:hypothetical protein
MRAVIVRSPAALILRRQEVDEDRLRVEAADAFRARGQDLAKAPASRLRAHVGNGRRSTYAPPHVWVAVAEKR